MTAYLDFLAAFRILDIFANAGPLVVEIWNENRDDCKHSIAQACGYMKERIREIRKSHAGQREKRETQLFHRP